MSERPKRIQRKRTKGWRMPPNTIYVGRPSKWGNPFDGVGAVAAYLFYLRDDTPSLVKVTKQDVRAELRGKDLCCWCSLDADCHADVLLEIANA